MIKHIVMWRLKDFANGADKGEKAKKLKSLLESLKGMIGEIKRIEVGININPSDAAFDVVLFSEFDSLSDLEDYQKHPEHLKVASFVTEVRSERGMVDYEI
ncbi:MAG: Dabb family protein [Ignavibacteriales bacterium]